MRLDLLPDRFSQLQRPVLIRFRAQDQELFTAPPPGQIIRPDRIAYQLCYRCQDLIPGMMAKIIVNGFKMVDIEHDRTSSMTAENLE
jgi:hypothetical protein